MTLMRLSSANIAKVAVSQGIFITASVLTGVPWQAIAAVWYRESFSIAPPKTPGGPFQFDPEPSPHILEGLLKDFSKLHPAEIPPIVKLGVNDFQSGAIFCACWLRHQSRFNLAIDHSDEAMKDAFYGYNGRAWGPHPESSPYVYNNFDEQHMNMVIRGSIPDGKGGRKFISTIDQRPGAFTVYKQLVNGGLQ